MKCAALALLSAIAAGPCADAARLQETPVSRVVTLINELKDRIEQDGTKEQQSYDKYACWCEDTLSRKVRSINKAKDDISGLETKMKELKAETASHGAEIDQLKSDIKGNVESQREANEVREKETMEYTEEKTESEQCIGALEAAIKVLTGAGGTGKKGFLETMKEAQLLSVVAGVRGLLKSPVATKKISDRDLDLVKHFVDRPEEFVGGRVGVMSAAQIANNPFGDYAPQSTQIQGILKGMYEAFVGDMEKANAEESDQQKSHEDLMATKQSELKTLQETLEKQNLQKATKTEELATSKRLRDDTADELEANEAFFADTKEQCKVKATEWSERTRLRTEELQGITTAIGILSSPEAQSTFTASGEALVQIDAKRRGGRRQAKAFSRLRGLARHYRDPALAQMAAELKTGGHFDKVIVSIDKMIELLRKEEASDTEHRDRCQNAMKKNGNDLEDVNSAIDKSDKEIGRLGTEVDDLSGKIKELKDDIADTRKNMKDALDQRNTENKDFKKTIKDDTDAIALLERALVSLARFYKSNKINLSMTQKANKAADDPEYSADEDKAPQTSWSGSNYGGRKSENEGILAIISMLKEDLQKEMSVARREEAESEQAYEKTKSASQRVMDTQTASKVAAEQDLAAVEDAKTATETKKEQQGDDKSAQLSLEGSIKGDCSWVATHYETRRQKRKTEIDGLVEAKGYLAGVDSGDE